MSTNRFLLRMAAVGAGSIVLAAILSPTLGPIFKTNPALNGMIIGVLIVGLVYSIQQILALRPEIQWLEEISDEERLSEPADYNPKILSPLATLLGKSTHLSASSLRAVLDGVDARLQESRDINRYLVGLLVFLGLLGTFWGLSLTIASVADVISGLPSGASAIPNFLEQLKEGLQSPLKGMGVAFSSSLFGLASSLILGFFELQANQARHQFFNVIEEALTNRVTSLSGIPAQAGGEGSMPAYIQALLEQTAENLDGLQRATARTEQERQVLNSNLSALCDKFAVLVDQRGTEKTLLLRLAEGMIDFQKHLQTFSAKLSDNDFGLDNATKQNISSLNETAHQLLDATSAGQASLAKEIRSEIRVLTKTLNNLAAEAPSAASQP